MDSRLDAAPVVAAFAREVARVVELVALYAAGSLAAGDYRAGVSDLDLVAVVGSPLHPGELRRFHERFALEQAAAEKLHCVGSLITKAEALARLPRFGVPAGLCEEIARRRRGEEVSVSAVARLRRALLARRLVARGIRRLAG